MSVKTKLLGIALLAVFWAILTKLHLPRIGAYGCFDDCFNIVGGYFIVGGRALFSQLFFNHQPLMAYMSAAIQWLAIPASIYELIRIHRLVVLGFAALASVGLWLRFGWMGLEFALLYELTKPYVFGERFLAEGLIVYPLVYLAGLALEALLHKKHSPWERIVATGATWFVVFAREPYIPLVLFLYGILLWQSRKDKATIISIVLFGIASILTILPHDIAAYSFNILTASKTIIEHEAATLTLFQKIYYTIAYPIALLSGGLWNPFRIIETIFSGLFLLGTCFFLRTRTGRWTVLFVWIALALAHLRPPWVVGEILYGNFHHLPWYALFLFFTLWVIHNTPKSEYWFRLVGVAAWVFALVYTVMVPTSWMWERVDRQSEFTVNYAQPFVTGEVIRLLSAPGDTMFVDQGDDLIYWQAKLPSPYRYGWYATMMPLFQQYKEAREEMFKKLPPTFLYRRCANGVVDATPVPHWESYVRIIMNHEPSCLFIHASKLPHITQKQWNSVLQYRVSRPQY